MTYLDYGDKRRAYGSALLDPVTGVLVAFLVSEHNDVELALETLRQSDTRPCPHGGIYHSDHGNKPYDDQSVGRSPAQCGCGQSQKGRTANAKKRKTAQQICKTPEMIVERDQRILRREISKWTRSKATAIQQISHLKKVLKNAQKAGAYLMFASTELIAELADGRNWGRHPELSYIYEMRALF